MDSDNYRHNEDWHEWSCDTTGCVEKNKPSRTFLRLDQGLVTLSEDLVTSSKPTARELNTEHQETRCITSHELFWLLKVLPQALLLSEHNNGWEYDPKTKRWNCPECNVLRFPDDSRELQDHMDDCQRQLTIEHAMRSYKESENIHDYQQLLLTSAKGAVELHAKIRSSFSLSTDTANRKLR